jgi:glutaredoxin
MGWVRFEQRSFDMGPDRTKTATLYRMVMADHVCPWGLKTLDLLRRKGFRVDDHPLRTHAETEAFKAEHQVKTTPQVFIDGRRIGGYEDLRRHFGLKVIDPKAVSYRPVLAVFGTTALMAMAVSQAAFDSPLTLHAAEWFVGLSMMTLAMLKLQNVESFATMFLNYDLLARRWVRYGKIYPFAELGAGTLMVAGALTWVSAPVALFIGGIGAVSVFKAVYIDKRELKCACVGGGSNVPLGFISLTENLMMIAMAIWMLAAAAGLTGSAHPMTGLEHSLGWDIRLQA